MARIRTIKPEFPHSESMGRVSRDARLTFIELWTLADDRGRLRGNSRMLASLLFPYDDDAKKLIDGWLRELENEKCVARYVVDGTTYIQICNWLDHQKIDKPSGSKLPEFNESSRTVSNPREDSLEDQGSGSGSGKDLEGTDSNAVAPSRDGSPIERVFGHWQAVHDHAQAQLTEDRRKLIRRALRDYSEAILCQSISGYLNSPHHMGQNDRSTVYDDIELMLRNSKHIDAGVKFYAEPPRTDLSAKTRANVAAIADWKPPELRVPNAGQ